MSFLAAAAATEHAEVWTVLFQLAALLGAALVLGMLFERFGQSAILGYLIAGMLMGPGVFGVISADSGVPVIAELGVSLLLFAIGLEFSASRLIRLGPAAVYGGSIQVILTLVLVSGGCLLMGMEKRTSVAIGAAIALSSTACVLRVLSDRAEIDAVHGRVALGVLLLQDVAVVPLVLLVTMLGGGGSLTDVGWDLLKAGGLIVALVTGFLLLAKFVLPPLMRELSLARDRELLVLLSVVLAVGSALAAHALELSPALGAFLAGMMLAESSFATQIRSDIGGLRIIFITLFFASVGMLGDPLWISQNWLPVTGVTLLILFGKAAVVTAIALLFRVPLRHAIASGIVLSQVGEFGVVIAGIGNSSGLVSGDAFRLLVSSILATLFLTPLLIRAALPLGEKLERRLRPHARPQTTIEDVFTTEKKLVMIVGFGPSGQRVAEGLRENPDVEILVVDMNQRNVDLARSMNFSAVLGDATNLDFLLHHGILKSRAMVITLPDHRTSTRIVESVRTLHETVSIIVRARYHSFVDELERAGATLAIDEEYLTGQQLREAMLAILDLEEN
ncbi:MAG: cation:proton antiporter [Verrucomicrobiales bacterium]|nr:cation:proton antiporter [Verrucomicrobiales bacterium]